MFTGGVSRQDGIGAGDRRHGRRFEAKNPAGVDRNSPEPVPFSATNPPIARSLAGSGAAFKVSPLKTQVWALSPMCIFRDE